MHYKDAKSIISAKNGMNVYRGCTHGCIYCDSRSLCYHIDHAFTDIEVKRNAPELLEEALRKKRKKCMIGTGAMCDPYMHCEAEVQNTRKCLEIIEKYGFGVSILTKSDLILRDIDLLDNINRQSKCVVQMTMTTYDEGLCRKIEPNVCTTYRRYEVLKEMEKRGIPTVVWLTPILPFINDNEENINGLLNYCFDAKVKGILPFGIGLTLREGNREYFYSKLDENFQGLKKRYIEKFGLSYECMSDNNERLMKLIKSECRSHDIMCDTNEIFHYLHHFPDADEMQLSFF